jgi:hypothetical protein
MMQKLPDDASMGRRLGQYLLDTEVRIEDLEAEVARLKIRNEDLLGALRRIEELTGSADPAANVYWPRLDQLKAVASSAIGLEMYRRRNRGSEVK